MRAAWRVRLHRLVSYSRANGPGARAVIWVQGCRLACPGCFNPQTHSRTGGRWVAVEDLAGQIQALRGRIEGLTISGGEPLLQWPAVRELCRRLKQESAGSRPPEFTRTQRSSGHRGRLDNTFIESDNAEGFALPRDDLKPELLPREPAVLSIILFSGFTWNEISRQAAATGESPEQMLAEVDLVMAGRYEQGQRLARGLRGSTNKTLHFLTRRYAPQDLADPPCAELTIAADGEVFASGIDPVALAQV